MVSCDNTAFLLTQLRAAFVGGDDTGVCELLIDRIRVCDDEVLALLSPPCGAGGGESQTSLTEQPDPFGPPAGPAVAHSASDSQASLAGEAHSPDIIPPKLDSGQAPSRKKSATQMRVSAAREERQKEKKVALAVEWSDDVSGVTDSDLDYLFPAPAQQPAESSAVGEEVPTAEPVESPAAAVETRFDKRRVQNGASEAPKRQSLLARRLAENAESVVQNAFTEFSQFEVSLSRQGLRRIRVFFHDLDRSRPIEAVPIRDTTVEQFIGLACYKYTLEARQPSLPQDVSIDDLDLFMYEETDDLDADFPPLEKRDRIYKYDFNTLAVVQRHGRHPSQQQQQQQQRRQVNQLIVHVTLPQGFTTMQLDRSLPVSSLLEKIVRRRKLKEHRGHKYALRRADDVSVQVPLDTPLGDAGTTEFILVRDNSTPAQGTAQSAADAAHMPFGAAQPDPIVGAVAAAGASGQLVADASASVLAGQQQIQQLLLPHKHQPDLLDSLALRQYRLQLRGVINRDVMLSVSGDCIVLDHLGSKAKLFSKRSPSTYNWEAIGGCQLEERSGSSKATVQLYYRSAASPGAAFGGSLSTNFHCLSLEGSDARLVRELHAQINNVLLLRGGSARKLFLELTNK